MSKVALLMLVSLSAFAESAPSVKEGMTPFIPLLLIFAVFYFMILRPQQKKQKEAQKFIAELKRGDMVVTNSGIIGTVKVVSDKFITLEIDDGVCMKVLKNQIAENAASLKEVATKQKEATT